MKNHLSWIVVLLLLILCMALSWVICVFGIFLIAKCFKIAFELRVATGVWLLILLFSFAFGGGTHD